MSKESRSNLKTYFETGDCPTAQQFCSLIESTINQVDDCISILEQGEGVAPRVGIGTGTPTAKLHVAGDLRTDEFKMPTGAQSGHVLTADANGTGTWQAPTGGGGGGPVADITSQAFTYYDGVETVGGVVQPLDALKTNATGTTAGNIDTTYVYKADGRLDYYAEAKTSGSRVFTPVYDAVNPNQINSISITAL